MVYKVDPRYMFNVYLKKTYISNILSEHICPADSVVKLNSYFFLPTQWDVRNTTMCEDKNKDYCV